MIDWRGSIPVVLSSQGTAEALAADQALLDRIVSENPEGPKHPSRCEDYAEYLELLANRRQLTTMS